jgi:hypothetical protein
MERAAATDERINQLAKRVEDGFARMEARMDRI